MALDCVRNAVHGWKAPQRDPEVEVAVHSDDVFLSGTVVIDSKEKREKLTD